MKVAITLALAFALVGHGGTTAAWGAVGQRLIVAQGAEPETLDPHGTSITIAHNISFQIVERLLTQSPSGALEPALAERWRTIGEKTWRFHLRPQVAFTNGEAMNAEAVKFSIERLLKPDPKWGSTVAHYLSVVESVTAVDPLTVDVVTKMPFGLLPYNLVKIGIIPPQYVKSVGNAAFARQPIGTGPFVLSAWRPGVGIVLKRNDRYWGPKPTLAEVEFRAIPDPLTRVSALLAGDVHLITQLPVQEVARVRQTRGLKVLSVPSLRSMHLLVNALIPGPLQDRKVRQALNYAIDKEAIVQKALGGHGRVLRGQMLTEAYFGFNPELQPYPYDPKRARELLAAAGYPKGFATELATPRGRYMNDVEVVQFVVAYLEAIGVRVTLRVHEWAAYVGMLAAKKLPGLSFWGWAVTPADADSQLGLNTTTHRYSYYSNPAFDAVMSQARQAVDQGARRSLYRQATEMLREDASNVFLYQQQDLYGLSDRVSGWKPEPDEFLVFGGTAVAE